MADPTPPQTLPPAPPAFDGKPPTLRQRLDASGPWPIVALVAVGGATFASIAIFAPEDTRTALFGAHGAIMTLIGLWLSPPGK